MESKKINQLATEMSPATTDLTIVGDPITGVSKKITLEQIASLFAGSVSFYANLAAFPVTGTIDTIYCAKDTNKLYLWSGSAYVQTFPSQALLDTYQLRSEKGASNGYASLDSSGKVPVSQLPSSIMEYKGMWSAATNTPTLANGTGDTGDVYICNAAGSVNFGAGVITFAVGDYVIYSGSIWQRSSGAVGTVTSVAITESGDSLNITGSPITTSGTINIGFNGTNLQYVNGAGNLTTFPTLITSIGLSMPSAFSVANSPLTANGTIAVTGAGVASQYIRGDGTLATFPSNAGGGSSVSYYLNGSVNASVAGYKQMDNNAIIGVGTDFTLTGNGLIAQFLTDVGNPNRVQIPSGAWNFEMYFNSSSNGGAEGFYVELFKYDGSTFTLIATSSATPESITGGTTVDLYLTSLAVPTTALLTTDRLAVRVYIVNNGGGRTITLHTENNTLCEIITTFAGGIASLNGLTANTQYLATGTSGTDFNIVSSVDTHTFNIPDASATARGLITTGTQTIAGTKTFSDATKNNGGIFLQNASSSSLAGYMNIGGLTNGVKFTSGGGVSNTFTLPSATGYTFTFADITGTIAMLEGTQTFTGTKTFNANPSINTGGQSSLSILSSTGNSALIFGYVNNILKGTIDISATEFKFASAINSTFKFQASGLGIASLIFDNTTNYSYTFPNATGTIALVGGSGVGTVTSVAALTIGTTGTDLSSSVANSTTTPVITLNVPTASAANRGALSSADWTTFNNKQNALTNPVTGTGTTNYLPKFTGTSSIGNSAITDDGTTVTLVSRALSGTSATFSGTITTGAGSGNTLSSGSIDVGKDIGLAATQGIVVNNARILAFASTGAATFSSSVSVNGILQVKSTSSSPSIWAGAYGGAITILADNATSNRYLDLSIVDSVGAIAAQGIRVTSGGNVGIGTTSPSEKLTVSGNVLASGFFESSDSRLKTLIQDNYQTKGIASITPKLYTKNGKVELGYYAQDFVGVLDSAVVKGSDEMLSLSYREVHTAKIYALEQEIKELKAKMN